MKLDVLKPWIGKRVAEFIGMEDDVVVEFIFNQLEAKVRLSLIFNYFELTYIFVPASRDTVVCVFENSLPEFVVSSLTSLPT